MRCCGDPSKPLPGGAGFGVLTGIYDPGAMCCVQHGSPPEKFIISKHAPIDLDKCPNPIPSKVPIEVSFDGCSVPLSIQPAMMFLDPRTPYSGNPDEPTPPANGEALFSQIAVDPSDPMGPCDLHDRCYQTCGSDRTECDTQFGTDLTSACAPVTGTLLVPAPPGGFDFMLDRREVCETWAGLYALTVSNAGGMAHVSGQESHCDCECA
jgi:hypothetical protein